MNPRFGAVDFNDLTSHPSKSCFVSNISSTQYELKKLLMKTKKYSSMMWLSLIRKQYGVVDCFNTDLSITFLRSFKNASLL